MFEKYTERARRVIFFARYEASAHGVREIDTRCLLLGILREDRELMARLVHPTAPDFSHLWTEVEALFPPVKQKISTTIDLPLSHPGRRVLAMAAEEAGRRHSDVIEPRHILWGLFQNGGPETACMKTCGLAVEAVTRDLDQIAPETSPQERYALRRMIDSLPKDRLDAAAVLLAGLAADRFEVNGTGPGGPFQFTFGTDAG
jgi:ATP-dependent Clp protease ATP-binding subunit ClpC